MKISNSITIPGYWTQPKYSLGATTKQGIIVGLQYYQDNCSTEISNGSWRYAVTNTNDCEEVVHLSEEKIQLLSPQELQAELQGEIEICQRKIDVLKQQLKLSQLLSTNSA